MESARLGLDATKAKGRKGTTVGMSGEVEELPISDEVRADVERKEDEFVGVTEEAVGVMKNVSCSLVSLTTTVTCPDEWVARDCRSLIRPSLYATSPISLLLSLSSIRKPTRSWVN